MKYLFFFIALFVYSSLYGLSCQDIIMEDNMINSIEVYHTKYDSLSNIDIMPKDKLDDITKYIGQEIIFLKRDSSDESLPIAYINFEIPQKIKVASDTIWIKRRKRVKPKDYKVSDVYSNKYSARYFKNAFITYCGAEPIECSFHDNITKYYDNEYMDNVNRNSGYYTPYEEIEGKVFKILDISKYSQGSVESIYAARFTLQTNNGDSIYWYAKAPSSYPCNSIFYPVVIKGYLDKLKNIYLDKEFYINGSKFKCVDLIFFGKRKQYQIPHLVFKNDAETMFVKIGSYPSLFSYKKDESFNNPDLHYLSIIEPEKYEYELKKEIERKENDRKEEERKRIEYNNNLIKKFGKYYAKLILSNKVQIGMTKEMVRESWGDPDDINRTIGSFGVHEQWCYGYQYLYFEDGKLTVMQD